MPSSKSQSYSLQVTSDMANLEVVADFVAEVSRAVGLSARQFEDVHMAVDEAVTNVMEHAYAGRKDGDILIFAHRNSKELVIEIRDYGKPFDPARVKHPNVKGPLSRRTIGGLGIFFMKKLMDKVEFERDPAGNVTRLHKKLK